MNEYLEKNGQEDRHSSGSSVLALSGGVGGAKLAAGLASCLEPSALTIVANTGDDFQHLGLHIAPDLDSVMYALAGCNDRQRGWGIANESWQFMQAMENLGGETWFSLGDKDLATHVQRRVLLDQGLGLAKATEALCSALGIVHRLLPMSDQPVRTMVQCEQGDLEFQQYFVAHQCEPVVSGFYFEGCDTARANPAIAEQLKADAYNAVIICPSNPFVSVDPILSLAGVRDALSSFTRSCIAVSPIIGGRALKGPAAKMLKELNMPCDAVAVARHYQGLLSHFVIDQVDERLAPSIEALGMEVICTQSVMRSVEDQHRLANTILKAIERDSSVENAP